MNNKETENLESNVKISSVSLEDTKSNLHADVENSCPQGEIISNPELNSLNE